MRHEPAFDEESVPDLAQSDPPGVAARATRLLEIADRPRTRAVALWARGLARRELDQLSAAESDLRESLDAADINDDALTHRITASLAMVVLYRGNAAEANALMSFCDGLPPGNERGRLTLQRGLIRHRSGDLRGARSDYELAVNELVEVGETSSTRALINLGVLDVQQGDPARALEYLTAAREQADAGGHDLLGAFAEHNVGYAHASLGALSDALASYERAVTRFRAIGPADERVAVVEADRAEALLAANLLAEADESSTAAFEVLRESEHAVDAAEVALLAARVRLGQGDLDRAREAAAYARSSMEESGRIAWLPLIDALDLQIEGRTATGSEQLEIARRADALAERLGELHWSQDARRIRLLAIRGFIAAGDLEAARTSWAPLRRGRGDASPLDRAARNYCAALLADASGDLASARAAVTRGLRDLAESRLVASSYEVRAHVLAHLAELATLGLRLAIGRGDGRGFARCIERSRVMLLAGGAVGEDLDQVAEDLQLALRDASRRERDASIGLSERRAIETERRSLEREIATRARSATSDLTISADVGRLFDASTDATVLEYAEVDGRLWLAALSNGRTSLYGLEEMAALVPSIDHLRFGLSRLQRNSASAASVDAAQQLTMSAAEELRTRLIPERVLRRIAGDGARVVIVPARDLVGVPWAGVLHGRAASTSVAASGLAWLQAREAAASHRRRRRSRPLRVVAGHGPDLDHAEAEVAGVAERYPESVAIGGPGSTDRLLDELASADVAHLACHGSFRSDNPLFSALKLTDGDLSVYDLRRCSRLPPTIVLSACDVGRSVGIEGGAFLGLSTALLQFGVSSVIAPVTEVNDQRSIEFMRRLHDLLADGELPSAALSRAAVDDDGSLRPIAAPFVCFGA